jgi:transcriptional regulator with XRE-family HTH domain
MTEQQKQLQEEVRWMVDETGKRWGRYFRTLVREWQYADKSGGRILMTKVALGQLIGVSDSYIGKWLDGKSTPSRVKCKQIARVFDVPFVEVMQAAGINAYQDDSYNTFNQIMEAIREDKQLSAKERQRLDTALVTVLTPDWRAAHPDTIDQINTAINQPFTTIKKARLIATIIDDTTE